MAFKFRRLLDEGAGNPIVARLGIQAGELLKWSSLDKDKIDSINELYVFELVPRLINCERALQQIQSKLREDIQRVAENSKDNETSFEEPTVIGLQKHAEEFLYEAKNFLRELRKLLNLTYECSFEDAGAFADLKNKGQSKVVAWAEKQFGTNDALVDGLRNQKGWIDELVKKRNAVEHPGGLSGSLEIHNAKLTNDKKRVIPPHWNRTGSDPTNLLDDMSGSVQRLLLLAEHLLADVVRRTLDSDKVEIYEIPEGRRDPKMPIRLKVSLTPELAKKLAEAEAKKK